MSYEELLQELNFYAEEPFANFQRRLIFTESKILGVRTPTLRKISKKYVKEIERLMTFPDEYYEVTFIKLCAVSLLKYEELLKYVGVCVPLIDNWATCDTFKPKCLSKRKKEYLPYLQTFFDHGGEFFERYVLVTLLSFYMDQEYLPIIRSYIERSDTSKYYVHMAVAWLVAEILTKYENVGIEILNSGVLDTKTHNKAIQKARESFRINKENKERLNALKRK